MFCKIIHKYIKAIPKNQNYNEISKLYIKEVIQPLERK
jgi:hypothetical protein